MKRSIYTKKHPTWGMGSRMGYGNINVFFVEHDEARSEIGIHLFGDPAVDSQEVGDAWETAERVGFTRIFIHKLAPNVLSFEAYRRKRSA